MQEHKIRAAAVLFKTNNNNNNKCVQGAIKL